MTGGACTGPCAQFSLDVACGKDRGLSRVALTEGVGVRHTWVHPRSACDRGQAIDAPGASDPSSVKRA